MAQRRLAQWLRGTAGAAVSSDGVNKGRRYKAEGGGSCDGDGAWSALRGWDWGWG